MAHPGCPLLGQRKLNKYLKGFPSPWVYDHMKGVASFSTIVFSVWSKAFWRLLIIRILPSSNPFSHLYFRFFLSILVSHPRTSSRLFFFSTHIVLIPILFLKWPLWRLISYKIYLNRDNCLVNLISYKSLWSRAREFDSWFCRGIFLYWRITPRYLRIGSFCVSLYCKNNFISFLSY